MSVMSAFFHGVSLVLTQADLLANEGIKAPYMNPCFPVCNPQYSPLPFLSALILTFINNDMYDCSQ